MSNSNNGEKRVLSPKKEWWFWKFGFGNVPVEIGVAPHEISLVGTLKSMIWTSQIRLHFDLNPTEQKVMIDQSQLAGKVVTYATKTNLETLTKASATNGSVGVGASSSHKPQVHRWCDEPANHPYLIF